MQHNGVILLRKNDAVFYLKDKRKNEKVKNESKSEKKIENTNLYDRIIM